MKFRILNDIEKSKLKWLVPTAYKGLATALESTLVSPLTLITFPHDKNNVVKSSLVCKVLSNIDQAKITSLVVVGGCFSLESVELLNQSNAYVLNLSEFDWSDARHSEVRSGEPKNNDKF